MRILGIDPGSRITGYGVIESVGAQTQYIACGCIRINDTQLAEKLNTIYQGVQEIIQQFQPVEVAIEKVFMHRNADSALKLGQARGAAICAVASNKIPVLEYSPDAITQSVVGKGHAKKEQVQHMIKALLGLDGTPSPDAADALAVALCHINTRGLALQLANSGANITNKNKKFSAKGANLVDEPSTTDVQTPL